MKGMTRPPDHALPLRGKELPPCTRPACSSGSRAPTRAAAEAVQVRVRHGDQAETAEGNACRAPGGRLRPAQPHPTGAGWAAADLGPLAEVGPGVCIHVTVLASKSSLQEQALTPTVRSSCFLFPLTLRLLACLCQPFGLTIHPCCDVLVSVRLYVCKLPRPFL